MPDVHVVRFFSSLITIRDGKVAEVTEPEMSSCRMAEFFYKGLRDADRLAPELLKEEIKKVVEYKISRFGFCAKDRVLWQEDNSVPYGASEILAHGLRTGSIDCAVTVCDGAGTVITDVPQVVQGIGARMHTVIKTSPIPEVAARLRGYGCIVPFEDAAIDQKRGVAEASKNGSGRIAVTVSAFGAESFAGIREAEESCGATVTILATCTTGARDGRIDEMGRHADLVWACGSGRVRERIGAKALRALSKASPVYVLTEKGEKLVSGYAPEVYNTRREAGAR